MRIWYYRPYGYDLKPAGLDMNFIVDAKGRRMVDIMKRKKEEDDEHPLNVVTHLRIKSSMVEVPND